MIPILLVLGLGAAVIALLHKYWKQIVGWIKKAVEKIKEVLNVVVKGTRTFITKTLQGFQNSSKYYNENEITGEWEETVYTKMVDESEVPAEILAKVRVSDIDIEISTTEELKLAISA